MSSCALYPRAHEPVHVVRVAPSPSPHQSLGSRAPKTRTVTLAQGPTGLMPGLLSETKCQGEMETSVPDPIAASPSVWGGRPVRESSSFVGWRVLWPNEQAPLLPRPGQSRARCQGSRRSDKGRHAKVLCQWSRSENPSSSESPPGT